VVTPGTDPAEVLGSAVRRFTELVETARGDEPVPGCPAWTVDDLVEHVGTVHRWAAAILLSGQRLDDPAHVHVTEPRATWYAGTAAALLAAVRAVPGDEPTPNFARTAETAAFWPRRQTHEVTVHAVDVAQSLGLPADQWGVSPEVAADGVEEVLTVFFTRMTGRGRRPHLRGRVRFTATDVDRAWVVGEGADERRTPVLLPGADGDPDADAEVRGAAVDLYLGLWRRVPHDRLVVDGPAARELLDGPLVP